MDDVFVLLVLLVLLTSRLRLSDLVIGAEVSVGIESVPKVVSQVLVMIVIPTSSIYLKLGLSLTKPTLIPSVIFLN